MTSRGRLSWLSLSLVVLLAATLMSIGSRSVSAQDATPTADMGDCVTALGIGNAGDSCINIIHASPDAPAVDVYLDGTAALTNLAFGTASGWVAVPAGAYKVQVTATGAAIDTAVIDADVTLEGGAAYEVAAVGLLANIQPAVNQVNLSATAADSARVRVIHASPDAPAVDVAVTGGDVLVPNLAFPSTSAYLDVPAGSYDLEVRPTGTTDVALALPGVTLDATIVYSVYAIGQVADSTLTVLVITSTTTGAPMATPTA